MVNISRLGLCLLLPLCVFAWREPYTKLKVMCVGDSLTFGATRLPEYPNGGYRKALSDQRPDLQIVGQKQDQAGFHDGHRGWTAIMLAERAPFWCQTETPDIAIVMAGTNDLACGLAPARAARDLDVLVDSIKAKRIYVLTIPPISDKRAVPELREAIREEFNKCLLAEASDLNATVLDTRSILSEADLSSDGIHLTNEGYAKLGAYLAGVIK